jgi:hypothetical protein
MGCESSGSELHIAALLSNKTPEFPPKPHRCACIRINSVDMLAQLEVRGGVFRGQCRYQTPHPQRCAATALRAKADAMALWDDDPDPKPAPLPILL